MNNLKDSFEDPKLRLSEATQSTINDIGAESHSLAKEKFQKFVKVIRPELKRVLSDCERKNKLLFQESGEHSCFKTCYPQYSGSLFHWCDVSRRSLAAQSIAVGSALNLGPTTPQSSAPAPSLANESPDSSTDVSVSLAFSTSPPSVHDKRAVPARELVDDYEEEEGVEGEGEEEGETDHNKIIIIACVATAVVTSLIAALILFLCCHGDSGSMVNDESPLLSLRSDASGNIGFPFSTYCCPLESFDNFFN